MSISNYSDLSTDLQARSKRSDLSTIISTTIQLLEDELNRKLRCRQMLATTTLSATSALVALPADFLQLVTVSLVSSDNHPLQYVTPEQMEVYDRALYTGEPRLYTIIGSNLKLAPPPDTTYTLNIEYYQKIPGLEANSTNWLLTAYPVIYVCGGILGLFEYVRNADVLAWAKQKYDDTIADINRADDNAQYSGSVLRVRSDNTA